MMEQIYKLLHHRNSVKLGIGIGPNCCGKGLSIAHIITINKRITRILDRYGYVHEDTYQDLGVLRVYPSEFFCAYDGKKRMTNITDKTLATHHYTASWLPWYRKIRLIIGTKLRHIGVIK